MESSAPPPPPYLRRYRDNSIAVLCIFLKLDGAINHPKTSDEFENWHDRSGGHLGFSAPISHKSILLDQC
jgi:hypothetical protein